LREFCNLGYAEGCGRLPLERAWDSVRFAARGVSSNETLDSIGQIQVRYVCERGHRPGEHGTLLFDLAEARWLERHRDSCVQRMAECFLESYLEKRKKPEVRCAAAS
jgi:hypothetical protein